MIKKYTGSEKFIMNDKELPYSMTDFWSWTLSCIHDSMTRGSFAEHIVKIALDNAGYNYNDEPKTGMELYDLDGPVIPATGKESHIEVKHTGYFRYNPHIDDYIETKYQRFSIEKKHVPDKMGDFSEESIAQRNNDIYVFAVYTAKDKTQNIFDLSLWDFYVMPTFQLDQDSYWSNCKSISLKSVQKMCEKCDFNSLPGRIAAACEQIIEEKNDNRV